MTYLAASIFFSLVLLGALVGAHMTVRHHWREIVLALRGELGRSVSAEARPQAPGAAMQRRPAAF